MNSWVIFALAACISSVCCTFRLQILHTNDMHARFEEVDQYASSCTPSDAKAKKCYGGFARIREAAIKAKMEAKKQNISSIFLNAGDTFQGTPYYTLYKWRVAATVINTLEFDAMCLGNHEFDDGIDNLVEYLAHVKTPTVTANLNRTSDRRLNETNVFNSAILDVDGVKIGIVGYLTPDTMMNSRTENLHIFDEIPCIRTEAKRLKSEGVKIVIGLGHSGLRMDKKIANEVEEVDIIVGGHSHSLLYTPKDEQPNTERIEESYPYWVTQKSGKRVPIVQSSAFTKYFGRLMVTFGDNWRVKTAEGNSHLLDHTYKKNSKVEKVVNSWTRVLRDRLSTVIGNTRVLLKKPTLHINDFESNIGNLITDAFLEAGILLAKGTNNSQWTEHPVAVQQNGGIRSQIDSKKNRGNFTLEDMLIMLPFENKLHQCRLTGADLREALELSVTEYESKEKSVHYFLNFSGLRVTYDLKRTPGERVTSAMVLCTQCSVPKYETLNDSQNYMIILNDYLLQGGDNYHVFKRSCTDVKDLKLKESDPVVDYVKRREVIYPIIDGRIEVLGYEDSSMASNIKWSFYAILISFFIVIEAAV